MGGGVDLRYYYLNWSEIFLISSVEIRLEIDEFSKFIIENKVENIFLSEPSKEFLKQRNIKLRFDDSRVFFIFVEHCAYWSDSWGFYEIEDFRESESNGTFFAINRLREEYKGKVYWQDSVGSIYEDSKNSGYSLGDDFEKSVRFFDGYVAPNIISTTIMKYAHEKGFRTINEVLTADKAGFLDIDDYSDGREFKAPDKSTLESFRALEKLKYHMSLKNKTNALLFAVLLKIKAKLKEKESDNNFSVKLDEIWDALSTFMPKNNYVDFSIIPSLDELRKVIIENSSYSLIGFYDRSNDAFQFSELKLYVDASNILHNGSKKGYPNKSSPTPNITYLKECLRDLKTNSIKVTGIYIDSGTLRSIKNSGPDTWKEYTKIVNIYKITPTFEGEEADNRLIQKIRDDPNCYVITNDGFGNYDLNDNQRGRLISFQRSKSGSYRFYMFDRTNINEFLGKKNQYLEEFLKIKPLRDLGNWPYKDAYETWEIEIFGSVLIYVS